MEELRSYSAPGSVVGHEELGDVGGSEEDRCWSWLLWSRSGPVVSAFETDLNNVWEHHLQLLWGQSLEAGLSAYHLMRWSWMEL